MNLFNVNDYASDNQISALKNRIIELERQNNELSDIIIRDQSEISRLYARIQNELEPRLMAEKRSYDAFVSTDRAFDWSMRLYQKIKNQIDEQQNNNESENK